VATTSTLCYIHVLSARGRYCVEVGIRVTYLRISMRIIFCRPQSGVIFVVRRLRVFLGDNIRDTWFRDVLCLTVANKQTQYYSYGTDNNEMKCESILMAINDYYKAASQNYADAAYCYKRSSVVC